MKEFVLQEVANHIAASTGGVRSDGDTSVVHTRTFVARNQAPVPMAIDYWRLFWIFVAGSVAGLVIEVVFHLAVFGGYENRAGLVWGPFSPLYGVGAGLLTLLLNRLGRYPGIIIFLVAMVSGSVLEYATSWLMEFFFGAVAWDYSDTFANIEGRTNLAFGLMWGALGLAWARIVIPLVNRSFTQVNWKSTAVRSISVLMSLFMVVNIVVTIQALNRENDRANGLPAQASIDYFLDEYFPSTWMQEHFHMSIYGTKASRIAK